MDVVGKIEIADRLGVSRQRIDKLSKGGHFPPPLADLAIGLVWDWDDVRQWAISTGRLPADDERQAGT